MFDLEILSNIRLLLILRIGSSYPYSLWSNRPLARADKLCVTDTPLYRWGGRIENNIYKLATLSRLLRKNTDAPARLTTAIFVLVFNLAALRQINNRNVLFIQGSVLFSYFLLLFFCLFVFFFLSFPSHLNALTKP